MGCLVAGVPIRLIWHKLGVRGPGGVLFASVLTFNCHEQNSTEAESTVYSYAIA